MFATWKQITWSCVPNCICADDTVIGRGHKHHSDYALNIVDRWLESFHKSFSRSPWWLRLCWWPFFAPFGGSLSGQHAKQVRSCSIIYLWVISVWTAVFRRAVHSLSAPYRRTQLSFTRTFQVQRSTHNILEQNCRATKTMNCGRILKCTYWRVHPEKTK